MKVPCGNMTPQYRMFCGTRLVSTQPVVHNTVTIYLSKLRRQGLVVYLVLPEQLVLVTSSCSLQPILSQADVSKMDSPVLTHSVQVL